MFSTYFERLVWNDTNSSKITVFSQFARIAEYQSPVPRTPKLDDDRTRSWLVFDELSDAKRVCELDWTTSDVL
jgi:hypothetical protein